MRRCVGSRRGRKHIRTVCQLVRDLIEVHHHTRVVLYIIIKGKILSFIVAKKTLNKYACVYVCIRSDIIRLAYKEKNSIINKNHFVHTINIFTKIKNTTLYNEPYVSITKGKKNNNYTYICTTSLKHITTRRLYYSEKRYGHYCERKCERSLLLMKPTVPASGVAKTRVTASVNSVVRRKLMCGSMSAVRTSSTRRPSANSINISSCASPSL